MPTHTNKKILKKEPLSGVSILLLYVLRVGLQAFLLLYGGVGTRVFTSTTAMEHYIKHI